jgi:hypothetical protein
MAYRVDSIDRRLDSINRKMDRLRTFVLNEDLLIKDGDVETALRKLLKLKECIGNYYIDIHFLSKCLAYSFLKEKHGVIIDLTTPEGSAGLDIKLDEIVGEIKTTKPYLKNDFGADQKEKILGNLERLEELDKTHKYLFVIYDETERILKQKYSKHYPSVKIVNLIKELVTRGRIRNNHEAQPISEKINLNSSKESGRNKYQKLEEYLRNSSKQIENLTYEDIERIIGTKLPSSACKYRAWWSNSGQPHAKTWSNVNWKVSSVDIGKSVTFKNIINKNNMVKPT